MALPRKANPVIHGQNENNHGLYEPTPPHHKGNHSPLALDQSMNVACWTRDKDKKVAQ
jgi:hypothetical protein